MDSNNFKEHAGVGEREGRIACNLVAKRHFLMTHGIGRSENIAEVQPNATGSSLMIKLVNAMLLESIRFMGKYLPTSNIIYLINLSFCFVVVNDYNLSIKKPIINIYFY